jgi:hypothetical protein
MPDAGNKPAHAREAARASSAGRPCRFFQAGPAARRNWMVGLPL